MTDHKQAAIEAGARTVTPHLYYMYDEWDEATNEDRATAIEMSTQVIEAALPHLREMIAADIRAIGADPTLDRPKNDPLDPTKSRFATDFEWAAQIAKGPQQ